MTLSAESDDINTLVPQTDSVDINVVEEEQTNIENTNIASEITVEDDETATIIYEEEQND
jgi:hypothetical protein